MEWQSFGSLRALQAGPDCNNPLLVIHGMFGSPANWLSYGQIWAEGRSVSLLELPCHGGGGRASDLNYSQLAHTLAAGIISMGLTTPCTVLGHSLGGKAAMALALLYPQLVGRLVVVDIAPRMYVPHHQNVFHALESVDLTSLARRSDADKAMATFLPDRFLRAFFLKSLIEQEGEWHWQFDLEQIKLAYGDILAWDIPGQHGIDCSSYTGPALLVRGESSDYILPGDDKVFSSFFPYSEIRTVAKAGHWVQADNRAGFLAALEGYL